MGFNLTYFRYLAPQWYLSKSLNKRLKGFRTIDHGQRLPQVMYVGMPTYTNQNAGKESPLSKVVRDLLRIRQPYKISIKLATICLTPN